MSAINIYMTGVGGQGIGLLSEVISRACLDAGYAIHGCDTHGLAQRGGTVVSQLRLGEGVFTPQVPQGEADVIVALERLEGLRAARTYLKQGGVVFYYDSEYQPIHVRLGISKYPSAEDLSKAAAAKSGTAHQVLADDLEDPRMQNVALLAKIGLAASIPKITTAVIRKALSEVIPSRALESNLALFDRESLK